jgi:hypothetical protein
VAQREFRIVEVCPEGTVTLIELFCCAVGFRGMAMDQCGVVGVSGCGVECGDLMPDREAAGHFGSPLGTVITLSDQAGI